MTDIFKKIKEFNERIIKLEPVENLNDERFEWFKNVIKEEMMEFTAARQSYDNPFGSKMVARVDMLDALIDMLYFIIGRIQELGFDDKDFDKMFSFVHNANMQKEKGNKGRGSDTDAVKPKDWQGPETKMIKYLLRKEYNERANKQCEDSES